MSPPPVEDSRIAGARVQFLRLGAIRQRGTGDGIFASTARCRHDEETMTDTPTYMPPKVWTWEKPDGGRYANTNRPIAGATHEKVLPVGKHPLQLYSLATPNGVKVTIMLEELLALG